SDSDEDSLTYSLLEHSDTGAISLDPQTGVFNFIPQTDFEGIFRFRYLVNDGSVDSEPAASWIAVASANGGNLSPIVANESEHLDEDSDPDFVAGNVLENDHDPEEAVLSISHLDGHAADVGVTISGVYGALMLDQDGDYIYTLDNANAIVNELDDGETLIESFVYTVTDGDVASTGVLAITVHGSNDDPPRDDLLVRSGDRLLVAVSQGNAFSTQDLGAWADSEDWQDFHAADFNGDGLIDVVGRQNGTWWVGIADGSTIQAEIWGQWSTAVNWIDVQLADVDGDGNTDVVGRTEAGGNWWVAKSNGTEFVNQKWGRWAANREWTDVQVADVNGDGMSDLVGRLVDGGTWWVGRSTGTEFVNESWGVWSTKVSWMDVSVADVNGDGKDDVLGRANGKWWVSKSTGNAFANEKWGAWANHTWNDVQVGDFDGDGLADLLGRTNGGEWWLARSNGTKFENQHWGAWSDSVTWFDVSVGDFDGDGRDDVIGRHRNRWWLGRSTAEGLINEMWGQFADESWMDLQIADFSY
ncbi:MAG: FG-GAP-like repeat-containing protein, partial [Pirellulaceae bacterium]|nr:FG-GAP-like repeat-containing protein [Pirellulaceae bacterium]